MKKFSIIALSLLSLVGCATNNEKKTAMEWAKIAVEEEHYILDDDGYLLTHQVELQFPSIELAEETEGKIGDGYIYAKDGDGNYYTAFFKHSLIVEKYSGKVEEYVYISAIAWKEKSSLWRSFDIGAGINPKKIRIHQWQILDLDIEELE